jgi:hypothetical protein
MAKEKLLYRVRQMLPGIMKDVSSREKYLHYKRLMLLSSARNSSATSNKCFQQNNLHVAY